MNGMPEELTYQGRKMIDGDDCTSLSDSLGVHLDGWFGERSVDVVNWDRIVGVGSATHQLERRIWSKESLLARDINDHCESSTVACLCHEFGGDEFGNWLREVDTVDKDINVNDLLERSSLGSLLHIPLDNVVPTISFH
jgi:hypothetical protein